MKLLPILGKIFLILIITLVGGGVACGGNLILWEFLPNSPGNYMRGDFEGLLMLLWIIEIGAIFIVSIIKYNSIKSLFQFLWKKWIIQIFLGAIILYFMITLYNISHYTISNFEPASYNPTILYEPPIDSEGNYIRN